MFGHNEDNQQDNSQPQDNGVAPTYDPPVVAPEPVVHDGSLEEPSTFAGSPTNDFAQPTAPDPQTNPISTGHDDIVTNDNDDYPAATAPDVAPAENQFPAYSPVVDSAASGDLLELKQKALQQLSPLVGQLNQTPEEKFHTTMMMIQASDNKDLLPDAYEAAQGITDDKARAQALLDVINEINYFTQAS